ncbi:sensor histidine kinase [Alkalihalobacillus pseudalcaliphilus]|uniref:sensor histidine kinase n=1 Tax=Alkalihalobacillus pseudalcaliphilus TaxID=79884 RepID=UPI00064E01BE|nr:sensor histidine kinase [Alkalihalobacillus pseudalcaliphilus]KMK76773.1 histidine kinase [Alkalihalobacillus pseudalcaliphilus]
MNVYWIWFLFHAMPWVFAFVYLEGGITEWTWKLLGLSAFFILFFILPLIKQRPIASVSVLATNSIVAVITLFPVQQESFNPFLLLILSLLIAEAYYRLQAALASIVGGVSLLGILLSFLNSNPSFSSISFISLYFIFFFAAIILFKQTKNAHDDLFARYDALLSEYRELKRRLSTEEETVRQEERVLIGHEIHDSVGHKLTALLMQLEAFRLKSNQEDQGQVQSLKKLANDSLEETRSAVKMLKSHEVGGLHGILRLIRKLETESFIRIQFSVKHGAFTVPLSGEQSFVIFRSVQEALTNVMKHSYAREAEVVFEAPGRSVFRFEVSNPVINNHRYQEGFGLTSMRERLEKIGGQLQVQKTKERFLVRGLITLKDQGGNDDTNIIG